MKKVIAAFLHVVNCHAVKMLCSPAYQNVLILVEVKGASGMGINKM